MNPGFESNGFDVIPGYVDQTRVASLKAELERFGPGCSRNPCAESELIAQFANEIGSELAPGHICVRSLLFDKTAERNWPVAWHQDLTIAVAEKHEVEGYGPWSVKDGVQSVQPPVGVLESMLTIRVHLDDATEANGALKVVPGSHLKGRIANDRISAMTDDSTLCECMAGDLLLMSPLILHASGRSQKPSRRRVLHFEFGEENALADPLTWAVLSQNL